MTIWLLISLLFIIFIYIFILKHSFVSPTVAYVLPFAFSSTILLFDYFIWKIDISQKTYLLIIASILFLSLGELYGNFIFKNKTKKNKAIKVLQPNIKFTYLCIIFIMITLYFYSNFVINVAKANLNNAITLLDAYRGAEKDMSLALQIGAGISRVLAYYFLYSFIQNYIFLNSKNFIYLIPVILYILIYISSSNRSELLYLFVFSIVVYYIFLKIKFNWTKVLNKKRITNIFLVVILVFVFFYLLGFLTGKSLRLNFMETINIYAGSPIIALDNYYNNFNYDFSNFGSETLYNENNFLNIIFNVKGSGINNLKFTNIGNTGYRTNIYTNIRRLLNDYNYFGLFFIQFLMGFLYSILYIKIKVAKQQNYFILIYSYFLSYLIFSVIEEKVICLIPTYTALFSVILFIILLKSKIFTNFVLVKLEVDKKSAVI